jgi:hypothetical protein
MFTVELLVPQAPLSNDHTRMFTPVAKPLTDVVAEGGIGKNGRALLHAPLSGGGQHRRVGGHHGVGAGAAEFLVRSGIGLLGAAIEEGDGHLVHGGRAAGAVVHGPAEHVGPEGEPGDTGNWDRRGR